MLTTFLYFVVRGGVRGLALGIAVIALAGALAAATLLPVGEASRINHRRKDVGYAEAVKLRLPPIHLTSLLLPNIRGNPRDYVRVENGEARPGNPYIGPYDFTEYCLYVGIPGLILAALGVAWRWRDRSAMAVCVAGTVGLALALGTPVGALFFYLVPGYAQFHAPARAVCMVHFALAALAAFGLDTALRAAEREEARGESQEARGEGGGRVAAVVCAGTALLCVAAWPLTGLQLPVVMSADWMAYAAGSIRHGVLFAAATGVCFWMLLREPRAKRREARGKGQGARDTEKETAEWAWVRRVAPIGLAALCAGDLLLWSLGYNPATDPRMLELPPDSASVPSTRPWERAISFETPERGLKSLIVPNYNVVVGYREAQGADSVHSRRYHLAMQAVAERLSDRRPAFPDGNTVRIPPGHHPLFDLLNVTQATTLPSSGPPAGHYVPQSDGELRVWRNPSAIGPGRVVTEVRQVRDVLEAVSALVSQSHDVRRTATVEGQTPNIAAKGKTEPASVGVRSFTPHRVVYDVFSPTQGLLVASEVAYPGWKARVERREARGEGQYARMYVADGIFRAVVVPPGASRVTFLYVPSSFRFGLFMSLISCGALAALAAAIGALKLGGGGKMRASVPSGI